MSRPTARPALASVLGPLWFDAADRADPADPAGRVGRVADWLVLPGPDRPRLLVPLGAPRAAAAALGDYTRHAARSTRISGALLQAALRLGAGPLVFRARQRVPQPAGGLAGRIRGAAAEPVHLAVHLGPDRPNRKPVLSLLAGDGRLVGVAKVGVTPLAARLVATERSCLDRLAAAPVPGLATPRVLRSEDWQGSPVVVQSVLPLRAAQPAPAVTALFAVVPAIAGRFGLEQQPFAESLWWRTLQSALDNAADAPAAPGLAARLATAAARLADRSGDTVMPFGSWHGDLTPWNVARDRGGALLAWDWERFETGVPFGLDLLHYRLNSLLRHGGDRQAAVLRLKTEARDLLARIGVPDEHVELTRALHALAIATRYVTEGHFRTPGQRGLTTTLVAAIEAAARDDNHRMATANRPSERGGQ